MQQVSVVHAPSPSSAKRVTPLEGALAFASEEEQEQRSIELLGAGALLVRLPPPTSHVRGHLGSLLEELVERELARAGAPSPYLAAWTAMPDEANTRLADQLLRAQAVGASGLAIAMGTLTHISKPSLCPDDSAILRWLAEATTALPLVLLIDDADLQVTGYAAPKPLMDLLVQHDAPVVLRGDDATSIESVVSSIDLADAIAPPTPTSLAPDTETYAEPVDSGLVDARTTGAETDEAAAAAAAAGIADADAGSLEATPVTVVGSADEPALPNSAEAGAVACAEPVAELSVHARVTGGETSTVEIEVDLADAIVAQVPPIDAEATTRRLPTRRRATSGASLLEAVMTPAAPAAHSAEQNAAANPPVAEQVPAETAPTADASAAPRTMGSRIARARTARSATAGAIEATVNDAWRSWMLALSNARGAQPLGAFEKLFAESYVPLANAIAAGLDDPRAMRAHDDFRRSFERSYTDAFATFGATNRRPRLVMDTFELATKSARLVGARSAHILLVDSMRFDLGTMVKETLARETSGVASLQSETLLWAALPTTTMRQLETLSRGMDAIRAPAAEEPSESLRGRAAEVVRRFRLGSREVFKLDLVPALLESAGTNAVNELPAIAQSVAEAIARHVTTLAPRTLLYIVGDHGFGIDRRGQIQTGGASPEEVLVPAQSWLIGDLH